MTFEIDTADLRAAEAALGGLDELVGRTAEPLLGEAGQAALDAVRSRASRHRRTGRMLAQVTARATGEGIHRRVVVRAGGPIAGIIAAGSSPHEIRPVRARALVLGSMRFAARVRHPGTRADPFVTRGLDDAAGQIDQDAARAGDRLADKLADSMTRR